MLGLVTFFVSNSIYLTEQEVGKLGRAATFTDQELEGLSREYGWTRRQTGFDASRTPQAATAMPISLLMTVMGGVGTVAGLLMVVVPVGRREADRQGALPVQQVPAPLIHATTFRPAVNGASHYVQPAATDAGSPPLQPDVPRPAGPVASPGTSEEQESSRSLLHGLRSARWLPLRMLSVASLLNGVAIVLSGRSQMALPVSMLLLALSVGLSIWGVVRAVRYRRQAGQGLRKLGYGLLAIVLAVTAYFAPMALGAAVTAAVIR